MVALIVVAFVVIAGGIAFQQFQARQARVRAAMTLAQRIGFAFSAADVEHVVDMPFTLFSKGDKRAVENVISGVHNGVPLRMFDYWYYDRNTDGQGHQSRSYHRFSCALVTIAAACPRLRLGHENLMSRLGDHLGLHDVEFEYDEFNRRFRVKCDDQRFAFSLLDGRMMQWLLGADTFETVEVDGPWVLLAVGKLDPARWLDLGTWLEQFHRQIPAVVYSTYPPR
ncbi:MAG TPA: hypothetical protein VGP92_12270 [Acidimicrobiia bacterium]|nr:hypothetical protein [Acidimicrobiia bacterium]